MSHDASLEQADAIAAAVEIAKTGEVRARQQP